MARPKLLGVSDGPEAKEELERWHASAERGPSAEARRAKALLKSLATFGTRARMNPLAAEDPVAHDRWPASLRRDYGADIPNLFRFELTERMRGYYSLVGEVGGVRVWILYLWDHERYNRESGYAKK